MDYAYILDKTKELSLYKPSEFNNKITDISFQYNNGRYYLIKDKDEERIYIFSDIDIEVNLNYEELFEKKIFSSFETLPVLDSSSSTVNNIRVSKNIIHDYILNLSIFNKIIYISFEIQNYSIVLKKYKINKNTYFENIIAQDYCIVIFGDKKTYYNSFYNASYQQNKLKAFDFYQLFLIEKEKTSIENQVF